MGSDISVWVEACDDDGTFLAVDKFGNQAESDADPVTIKWPFPRHYIEFALIGMTSRRPGIAPLVPSRGMPSNAWLPVRDYIARCSMVAASWSTAAELRALDWSMTIRHRVAKPVDDEIPSFMLNASVDHPVLDVDGTIHTRPDLLVFVDEGPDRLPPQDYPFVLDVPLVHVAPALHALMTSMLALRSARPETVRAVYAFDQW